jgi:hypothetical protein
MALPDPPSDRHGVILWQKGTVVCASRVVASNNILITVSVKDVVIERTWFSDFDEAAQFVMDKMRSYQTDWS